MLTDRWTNGESKEFLALGDVATALSADRVARVTSSQSWRDVAAAPHSRSLVSCEPVYLTALDAPGRAARVAALGAARPRLAAPCRAAPPSSVDD
ncbi:hypothetical protein EVAR_44357_1 [Eumeta japonica]|uniref:Uncharacterized protein n=1 Tax=Eumeta variegata TaxID=151549 RepID=A0A4C1XA49_EUMVA|nr:hypothetical protein EVAR_44357_1 [Eumeta japonica]